MISKKEQNIIKTLLNYIGDNPVVEIGVYKGETTKLIAEHLKKINKNNKVIGIDPFDRYSDPFVDKWSTGNGDYNATMKNVEGLGNVEIRKNFAYEVKDIKKASLIFLDGDHTYDNVVRDVEDWLPRAEIFLMHDIKYPSIKKAIKDLGLNVDELGFNLGKIWI